MFCREASKWLKLAVMVSCLVQQFASVGLGFGLSIMYAELIDVFDAKRSNAALTQGLYLGLSTGAGMSLILPQSLALSSILPHHWRCHLRHHMYHIRSKQLQYKCDLDNDNLYHLCRR